MKKIKGGAEMIEKIIPFLFPVLFSLWVGVVFSDIYWSYFALAASFLSACYYWNFVDDRELHKVFSGHPVNLYLTILFSCLLLFNFYMVSVKELQDSLNNIEIELHPALSKNPFDTVIRIRNNGKFYIFKQVIVPHLNSVLIPQNEAIDSGEIFKIQASQDLPITLDTTIESNQGEENMIDLSYVFGGDVGKEKIIPNGGDITINFYFSLKGRPLFRCVRRKRFTSKLLENNTYEWYGQPTDKPRQAVMIIPKIWKKEFWNQHT